MKNLTLKKQRACFRNRERKGSDHIFGRDKQIGDKVFGVHLKGVLFDMGVKI